MIYLLFALFLTPITVSGFTEHLRERLILGSAMLTTIKQECGKRRDEQNYDALRDKILAEPVPFYIKIADVLFSQSKEAQTATLWRETGTLLNEFLYTLMPFTAFGSAAVWHDPDIQARLKALYAQDDAIAFGVSMELLESMHQQLDAKLKQSHSWWYPVQSSRVFKDAHLELRVLLEHVLKELLDLRLLIQRIAPEFSASPFKYLVPKIDMVTEQLQKKYAIIKDIDVSPVKRWYSRLRAETFKAAFLRCMPPLMPMGVKR